MRGLFGFARAKKLVRENQSTFETENTLLFGEGFRNALTRDDRVQMYEGRAACLPSRPRQPPFRSNPPRGASNSVRNPLPHPRGGHSRGGTASRGQRGHGGKIFIPIHYYSPGAKNTKTFTDSFCTKSTQGESRGRGENKTLPFKLEENNKRSGNLK